MLRITGHSTWRRALSAWGRARRLGHGAEGKAIGVLYKEVRILNLRYRSQISSICYQPRAQCRESSAEHLKLRPYTLDLRPRQARCASLFALCSMLSALCTMRFYPCTSNSQKNFYLGTADLLTFPTSHLLFSNPKSAIPIPQSYQSESDFNTARKADCGIITLPTIFMRFLPFFCFSSSLRLRVISPP